MKLFDAMITSYILCNLIVINLADISRFLNLVLKLKVLTESFFKCIICQFPLTELKVMTGYVCFIVTTSGTIKI